MGSEYINTVFATELRRQTHFFCLFRAQGTCLVAANLVLFLLNES